MAAGSTAYLVAKVFFYNVKKSFIHFFSFIISSQFNSVSEDYLEVFFIVACLIIVWTEFAFYELKVEKMN